MRSKMRLKKHLNLDVSPNQKQHLGMELLSPILFMEFQEKAGKANPSSSKDLSREGYNKPNSKLLHFANNSSNNFNFNNKGKQEHSEGAWVNQDSKTDKVHSQHLKHIAEEIRMSNLIKENNLRLFYIYLLQYYLIKWAKTFYELYNRYECVF